MRAAIIIALKDLRRAVRDRSVIAISIVAPLALAFTLSSVLGSGGLDSLEIGFAVTGDESGELGTVFRDDVLGALEEQGFVRVTEADSPVAARALTQEGDVSAAFLLPAGFSEDVLAGRSPGIEVVTDPDAEIGAQVARAVAEQFAAGINETSLAVAAVAATEGAVPGDVEALIERVQSQTSPLRLEADVAGSREFEGKTFFAAGMAVFFLFFTAQFGAVSLLRERHEGTLARLLASPARRSSIIGGKALYSYTLGVIGMTVMVLASRLLMGAQWGDPTGVALLIAAGVFAAMGIQSLVTTLAKTDEQAAGYGSIVGVTLGLLGGTFFPLSQAPGALASLSSATPHALMMRGLGELSGGIAGPVDVLPPVLGLLAVGAIFGTLALMRSNRLVVAG